MSSRGLFITVEGIDGCGKSTQARLIAAALEAAGHDVLRLREPGGVKISEQIRAILLDPANGEMGDVCELLLYEAARAQLVHQVIRPALAAGKTVVCDRFYDSTTAYQAFADGLDRNMVSQANELAVDGCRPDLTLVFDLPVEDALRRRSGREAEDRLELKGLEFQERVAAGFRAVAADEPDRVKLIDAGGPIAEVFSGVAAELRSAGLSVSEDDVAAALQTCQGKC
ncbi:dTMP kinase [Collinsella intestinalis]|uniref:dTMP kinase n=1 Tax=Collinsella intestinalis TaxID=147207 RepID=UPI0022E0928B|nr:dTMP kinase [Collinsella intestinalis]